MTNIVVEKIKNLIEPIIIEQNKELYEVQYRVESSYWVLRVFLDNKEKNISLDECAEVSRIISEALDKHPELTPNAYNLEVSSPGLDRLLRNDSDFNWAMGKTLKVKFLNAENKKENIEGKLQKVGETAIELKLNIKGKTNTVVTIEKDSIESARRVMKFDEIMPKKVTDVSEI